MNHERIPDLVVLIPGIMGSVLEKHGTVVWGPSGMALAKALVARGAMLRDALTLKNDPIDVDDVDGVKATALFPDLHLIPKYWKIDGYSAITEALLSAFDLRHGDNFFTFPYDWRRDNRVAARQLAQATTGWLKRWRVQSPDAKLILICHSMGGLVARHFLELLDGWGSTRALITFGTPFRGSLEALNALVNGVRHGPFSYVDLTDLTRSFTSTYQLLPTYPCHDNGDGVLARIAETAGIPNVDHAKATQALQFHRDIEAAVSQHLKESKYLDHRYAVHPIVGVRQQTAQSSRLAGSGVEMVYAHQGRDLSGDGTVPQVSATPHEYSDARREMFAATKHSSLQNADAVLTQVLSIVTGTTIDLGGFRKPPGRITLGVGDLYTTDEPITITATPNREVRELTLTVIETRTGEVAARMPLMPLADGHAIAECEPFAAGLYAVHVAADGCEPASDAFAVVDNRVSSGL